MPSTDSTDVQPRLMRPSTSGAGRTGTAGRPFGRDPKKTKRPARKAAARQPGARKPAARKPARRAKKKR